KISEDEKQSEDDGLRTDIIDPNKDESQITEKKTENKKEQKKEEESTEPITIPKSKDVPPSQNEEISKSPKHEEKETSISSKHEEKRSFFSTLTDIFPKSLPSILTTESKSKPNVEVKENILNEEKLESKTS